MSALTLDIAETVTPPRPAAPSVVTTFTVLAAWLAAIGGGVKLQAFGFSVGTLAGLFALRPILLQRALDKGGPTNVDALIGQRCHVVEAIPAGGVGRVRVGAEEWRATCSDDVPAGADADVLGIEGNTLRVRRTPRPANTEGGA